MQAVRVHEGSSLRYETVPDPTPGPGEAVVELRAAGLNRRDLLVRSGTYPFPLPLVAGSDGASDAGLPSSADADSDCAKTVPV